MSKKGYNKQKQGKKSLGKEQNRRSKVKKGEKTREKNKETMAKYSKYNIIYLLQKWMDSVSGQTFMNYAYSWGAAVVILGTLFKLTHLAGADIMLFIGMGTEVFVFFIAAFDRPFDKTSDGRALATDSELAAELAKADEEEEKQEAGTEHTISGTIIFGNEKIIEIFFHLCLFKSVQLLKIRTVARGADNIFFAQLFQHFLCSANRYCAFVQRVAEIFFKYFPVRLYSEPRKNRIPTDFFEFFGYFTFVVLGADAYGDEAASFAVLFECYVHFLYVESY